MVEEFDVVVIGTGVAGSTAAQACADRGKRTAVVDRLPFGGTCALRGCDPKKVLLTAAEQVEASRKLAEAGALSGTPEIDWNGLMRFKRSFTEPMPAVREEAFEKAGIAAFRGRARFVDDRTLEVDGRRIRSSGFIIASGSRPAHLDIPGEDLLAWSDVFLDLDELPQRIAFVGGGFVSFEFAHLAVRAGARTFLLHRNNRPLPRFEPSLVDKLVAASREAGIDVRLGSEVEGVESTASGVRLNLSNGEVVEADLAVHGAGRTAWVDDMDLEKAGVEYGRRGVVVNRYLQSESNPRVWAAGDAADSGGPPLTPVGIDEGAAAAENLCGGNARALDDRGVANVVFSIPPLAATGRLEEEARGEGFEVEVREGDMSGWYHARRAGGETTAYKVVLEKGTGTILGAQLLGRHAEEVVNLFSMAVRHSIPAAELRANLFAYPTRSHDVKSMLG